jgi:hypothetical protein
VQHDQVHAVLPRCVTNRGRCCTDRPRHSSRVTTCWAPVQVLERRVQLRPARGLPGRLVHVHLVVAGRVQRVDLLLRMLIVGAHSARGRSTPPAECRRTVPVAYRRAPVPGRDFCDERDMRARRADAGRSCCPRSRRLADSSGGSRDLDRLDVQPAVAGRLGWSAVCCTAPSTLRPVRIRIVSRQARRSASRPQPPRWRFLQPSGRAHASPKSPTDRLCVPLSGARTTRRSAAHPC